MKFAWKICFSTIFVSIVIFSIGGYALMSEMFRATYQREIHNASEENEILRYSFVTYWNTAAVNFNIGEENVEKTAEAMLRAMRESSVRMRISDESGKILFDNAKTTADMDILKSINEKVQGHCLKKTETGYELQTVGAIRTEQGEVLYLETVRDVSDIFKERDAQYGIYLRWMAGMLLIESVCCYGMARWLLRPLKRLSKASGRIAGGDLHIRAEIQTRDEIGELAADFNHMAENLEKQFLELEEAAKKQEDFIGSFAHELKTPLTSMIGYADMLRTRALSVEEQFEAANYIFKEGKRLEALSWKLLELLVVKNQELERKKVSSKWLTADISGIMKPVLEKENISLEVAVEDAMLCVEPDLIKTVLLNLLDNGRKAIDKAGKLQLIGKIETEGYCFFVRDNGKGMASEELTRITEAFYMVDKSRARKQGGAGLGLSICAEIVKCHYGTLKFESIPEKGTCVSVYLPKEVLS